MLLPKGQASSRQASGTVPAELGVWEPLGLGRGLILPQRVPSRVPGAGKSHLGYLHWLLGQLQEEVGDSLGPLLNCVANYQFAPWDVGASGWALP